MQNTNWMQDGQGRVDYFGQQWVSLFKSRSPKGTFENREHDRRSEVCAPRLPIRGGLDLTLIARFEEVLRFLTFPRGSRQTVIHCAHRATTVLSWGLCEQERWLPTLSVDFEAMRSVSKSRTMLPPSPARNHIPEGGKRVLSYAKPNDE